jgi:hypothetical protein
MVPLGMTRRQFVSRLLGTSATVAPALMWGHGLPAYDDHHKGRRERSAILLWMGGGPSTIDIWDLKPGTATGGPFRPISTSGDVQICEHLPMMARQMHHFAVIRSMNTREADHERGCYYLRTGRVPSPQSAGCGGADTWGVAVGDLPNEHQADREPKSVRERYGENSFGRGCLSARQLVEQGAALVVVQFNGWDNHQAIFPTLQDRQLPILDRAMSALVGDLEQRELLSSTAIVWMGEFGRTPRINNDGGRDHWARAWSIVLGGAGIKGGAVIGETDRDGARVLSDSHTSEDVLATVRRALGVSTETALGGRRAQAAGIALGGKVIGAALA